jgi:hypothetical protein
VGEWGEGDRMQHAITRLVLAALSIVLMAPVAAQGETNRHKYLVLHAKVEKRHGKQAAGRNAVHAGLKRKDGTVRDVRQSDYKRLLTQLRRLLAPAPRYLVRKAAPPSQSPAGTQSPSVGAGGTLSAIAACESGGNPGAVGGGGTYRGKYQFDQQTWGSVGGSGDPASAPEAEQDKRAAMLYARRGASAWPVCGQ